MPPPNAPVNGFIQPCIPTRAAKPPSGPDWVHEIKHDGYRLIVRRDGENVRLHTRRGYDWSDRYPAIARTAARLRARSFTIDGEAAVCGPDGVAIFDALHRRGTVTEAMLFALDLLRLCPTACVDTSVGVADLLHPGECFVAEPQAFALVPRKLKQPRE